MPTNEFFEGARALRGVSGSTMRVQLENVDENQQRLFSKTGAMRLVTDRD
jgi:hypothetical protein